MGRFALPLALAVAAVVSAPQSDRAQSRDPNAWVRHPGVKLLAVEFYATWCKPCMKAVTRWEALR